MTRSSQALLMCFFVIKLPLFIPPLTLWWNSQNYKKTGLFNAQCKQQKEQMEAWNIFAARQKEEKEIWRIQVCCDDQTTQGKGHRCCKKCQLEHCWANHFSHTICTHQTFSSWQTTKNFQNVHCDGFFPPSEDWDLRDGTGTVLKTALVLNFTVHQRRQVTLIIEQTHHCLLTGDTYNPVRKTRVNRYPTTIKDGSEFSNLLLTIWKVDWVTPRQPYWSIGSCFAQGSI